MIWLQICVESLSIANIVVLHVLGYNILPRHSIKLIFVVASNFFNQCTFAYVK